MAMTDEETLSLLEQVLPNGINGTVEIQRRIKNPRAGGGSNYYVNGKAIEGGLNALKAWAKNNGYDLPTSVSGYPSYKTIKFTQDVTKAAWYDDVKNQTDKGMMFLNFAAQAKSVPQLAASFENSQLGSNAQRATQWGSATALLWEATNRAFDKGYTNFNDLAGGDKSIDLGTTYAGHGATSFSLNFANGTPYISTGWKDTSSAGDIAPLLAIGSMFVAPGLASALGGGVLGGAGAGAILSGANAALLGGDPLDAALKGALTGGLTAGISQVTPELSQALGGDIAGQAATGAIIGGAKAALTGGDVLESALKSAAMSGAAAATFEPQLPTESYDYASDAAQLAEQGLSSSQITDILGAADAAPDLASSLASYAVNAVDQGLTGPDVANYINNEFTADVQFAAADANQLFDQGLSNAQVGQTIDATGVPSSVSSLGQDASFIAADAQQLWNQTNNVGAVEQNLLATGVDPIVAATVANEVAMGATTNELTDTLLQASDPATLTTENTLFSENNMLPTSADLSPIKTSIVKPTENIPAVQATQQQPQQQQPTDYSTDAFLLNRYRNSLFDNPFLRSEGSYQSIVGSLFNG